MKQRCYNAEEFSYACMCVRVCEWVVRSIMFAVNP